MMNGNVLYLEERVDRAELDDVQPGFVCHPLKGLRTSLSYVLIGMVVLVWVELP
jgi:hypothetical protein